MISGVIHNQPGTGFPTYRLFSGGTELSSGDFLVQSLYVSRRFNKVPAAQLTLVDGSVPEQDFITSNQDALAPGAELEIQLGYSGQETTIFKGLVIKHCLKTQENQSSVLIVELKDPAVKMTVGRKNKYFKNSSDSDIMEEIVQSHGLQKDVAVTTHQHQEMVQYHCTDWDFLLSRAEANGKLVLAQNGKLKVITPSFTQAPKLELIYGQNIIEFETGIDARSQYAGVISRAWDFSKQQIVESEGKDPRFKEQGNLKSKKLSDIIGLNHLPVQHTGRLSDAELQSWSDAKLMRSRLAKVQGRIRILGYSGIHPGDLVLVRGMGDRFNGTAFVSGVAHSYGVDHTWYTDLQIGFDQKWLQDEYDDVIDHPSGGLVPAVNGLQIGIVTAISEDPDGEDRIQVRIPVIDQEDEGIWARIVSPDAGDNRGIFFRPEIDDEVIVGFLNDDPRDPIVLGCLFSSAKPAPITAAEENNEKGIITRSGIKLLFDDDQISWTLETPNGNTFLISDEEGAMQMKDENGNKVVLDSAGISLESAGDISLKATGDIKLEGTNINQSASAAFKAEGNSGAELSTSANAVIKGSIVQIN